jgi:Fur family ferric uptake transcriptional regulator
MDAQSGIADGSATPLRELIDRVGAEFRSRGERMTRPREVVLEVLFKEPGHVTAEQVVAAVGDLDESVHRASVYRSLEALCDVGAVQHIHLGHGATAFHLVGGERPHPHAQCRRCGVLLDLPTDVMDGVVERMLSELGFELDATHVALSGVCAECVAGGR